MASIFLSHSSQNNSEAIVIRDWMKDEGWEDVFLDLDPERGIKAGDRWQDSLKRASANCELVIFLISPAWAASKWCVAEFLLAKQLNKRIVGVIVQSTPFDSIPVEMSAEWQIVDLTLGKQKRTFSVQQATDEFPNAVHLSEDGLLRLRSGLQSTGLDPKYFAWPPDSDVNRSPYRGLKALEESDAGIFFGRDGPIVEGLDHLRGLREGAPPRMFVILSASGAGKSSYMRAGLMPRLRRDSQHFRILPVVRPNRGVLEGDEGFISALEQAFQLIGLAKSRSEIRKVCLLGADAVSKLIAPLLVTADEGATPPSLILPIDQGEELFQADGAQEAQTFLELLNALLKLENPSIIAMVTIRSDSYEPLQAARALEGIRQHTYSLPPMPRGSYGELILGPVRRLAETAGPFVIEDKLVDALLSDIEECDAKDSLPLLAFTMERLYRDEGGSGDLKLSEYQATGRIRGAIETAVKQALNAADNNPNIPRDTRERLELLRRTMIPALAGIDSDTGTPRRRVAKLSEIPAQARPLVELMIDQRLLTTDTLQETGETTVEPAHEALLRQWELLNGWLEEEAEDLGTAESCRRAARDWRKNKCDGAWLAHSGGRLLLAENVAARADFINLFGSNESAYLVACRQAEEALRAEEEALRQRELDAQKQITTAKKNRRRIFAGAFVVSLLFALIAGWQWRAGGITQARFLASNSMELSKSGNYAKAVALARLAMPQANWGSWHGIEDIPEVPIALSTALGGLRQQLVLRGHEETVDSAEFSTDGTRVFTTSMDGSIRIWNTSTGTKDTTLTGGSVIAKASFSPDGTKIVTIFSEKIARIWDTSKGIEIVAPLSHDSWVQSAAFSKDGTRVLTSSHDGKVRVWDAETGEAITIFEKHNSKVRRASFSPNGTQVVSTADDKTARIWDANTGDEIVVFDKHNEVIFNAAFSHDGLRVVTVSKDKVAYIWDALTGEVISDFNRHNVAFISAVFSSNDKQILTVLQDHTARTWDASSGDQDAVFDKHEGFIHSGAFSPDGSLVVTASDDKTARIWDASTGKELAILSAHNDLVLSAEFSSDGSQIVTTSRDATARIWNAKIDIQTVVLQGHTDGLYSASFSPDGSRVVTASQDGTARTWDTQTGNELAIFDKHESAVNSASFSPDGKLIVTASTDGTARIWEADTGSEVATFDAKEGAMLRAEFAPSGKGVFTVSTDSTTRFWDVETKQHVSKLDFEMIASSDSKILIALQEDRWAEIIEQTSENVTTFPLGSKPGVILNAAFSPDDTRVITLLKGARVAIWDVRSRELVTLLGTKGNEHSFNSALFSPNGTRVATALNDSTARIWDADTGAQTAILRGHDDIVMHIAFSPDGTSVVTASMDGTARISKVYPSYDALFDEANEITERLKPLTVEDECKYKLRVEGC